MPLIDSTYFVDSNIIANINEPDPNSKTEKVLDIKIKRGERDVLSFAFGWEMWNDFKQYIVNGIDPSTPQEYIDIINGVEYMKNDKKCLWIGLIQEETKESLLSDYVYCTYHNDNQSQTTGIGEVSIDNKIGNRVSMIPKVTKIWNEFIKALQGGFRAFPDGYTLEGKPYWMLPDGGIDYYGIKDCYGSVSLMSYLMDNKDKYPLLDTNYRRFGEFENELGI